MTLTGRIAWAVAMGAVFAAIGSLIDARAAVVGAIVGAVCGIPSAVMAHRDRRKSERYRASFDPADRAVHRPAPIEDALPFATRRHGRHPIMWVPSIGCAVGYSAIAVVAVTVPDASAAATALFGSLAALCWLWVVATARLYVDVRADGVVVRTPLRRTFVDWRDVSVVLWNRDGHGDRLLLRTNDGREVKATPFVVAPTGYGEERMLRLRDDVEQAWARSENSVRSATPPAGERSAYS